MTKPILRRKTILGIDAKPAVLSSLEREIKSACPHCWFDMTTSLYRGLQYLAMFSYDLVITDILHPPGAELVYLMESHGFPVMALMDGEMHLELRERFPDLKIVGVIRGDERRNIIPAIEQAMKASYASGIKRLFRKIRRLPDSVIGWMLEEDTGREVSIRGTEFF